MTLMVVSVNKLPLAVPPYVVRYRFPVNWAEYTRLRTLRAEDCCADQGEQRHNCYLHRQEVYAK